MKKHAKKQILIEFFQIMGAFDIIKGKDKAKRQRYRIPNFSTPKHPVFG